jgi:hypothetical protein
MTIIGLASSTFAASSESVLKPTTDTTLLRCASAFAASTEIAINPSR